MIRDNNSLFIRNLNKKDNSRFYTRRSGLEIRPSTALDRWKWGERERERGRDLRQQLSLLLHMISKPRQDQLPEEAVRLISHLYTWSVYCLKIYLY